MLTKEEQTELAELEKSAGEPVAYQYAHPYFGGGKIWREEQRWNGHTSDEARALYTTPLPAKPAPLGPALGLVEIREPTPEECERIDSVYASLDRTSHGRAMFNAVRNVMWPKEGL